jgi:hypothetical protein
MRTKTLIGSLILISAGVLAPVIPEDMKFISAWEYECTGVVPDYSNALFDPTIEWPTLEPCTGTKYTAAFLDSNGNKVYVPMTEQEYRKLGEKGGAQFNPKKEEFKSILEDFLSPTKVDAAIAYDNTLVHNCATGTSCTVAYTVGSGSNRAVFFTIEHFSTTDIVDSATYDGVAMTEIDQYLYPAQGFSMHAYYGVAPTSGSNNLVVNFSVSTGPQLRISSLEGVAQTGTIDAFHDFAYTTNVSSISESITTTVDNAWTMLFVGSSCPSFASLAGGANTTIRSASPCSYIADSNGPKTPAGSQTMSHTNGGTAQWIGVIASIAPHVDAGGEATTTPIIPIQGDVQVSGDVIMSR